MKPRKRRLVSVPVLILAVAAAGLFSSPSLFAVENWPEFRGPTGQGHSSASGLPTDWSERKNVAWKVPIPGKGWSSPVLVDGRLFLTTAVADDEDDEESDRSLRAIGVDAGSGAILWNVEVFRQDGASSPKIHKKNSHASPTPIVEGARLYVHFGHQGTACLDLEGKILWSTREFDYAPVHGNGSCPILFEDKLIFNCDAGSDPFVVALDKNTGRTVWKTPRNAGAERKFSFCTPLVIEVSGQKQLISPGSGAVCAYTPETGEEIWRVDYGEGYSIIPRPVFGHGLIFIGTGWNTPSALAIRPDGRGDVTGTHVEWVIDKRAPNTPSMLLVGDELYMVADSGIVSCVDAKSGKIHWQERVLGPCSASPLYADGKIYIQDEEGKGVVLRAGTRFRKLAENELDERSLASYAVGDSALFIRGEKHLYRIGE